jgi:hypothetical protein
MPKSSRFHIFNFKHTYNSHFYLSKLPEVIILRRKYVEFTFLTHKSPGSYNSVLKTSNSKLKVPRFRIFHIKNLTEFTVLHQNLTELALLHQKSLPEFTFSAPKTLQNYIFHTKNIRNYTFLKFKPLPKLHIFIQTSSKITHSLFKTSQNHLPLHKNSITANSQTKNGKNCQCRCQQNA